MRPDRPGLTDLAGVASEPAPAPRWGEGPGNSFLRKLSRLAPLSGRDEAALLALTAQSRVLDAHTDLIEEGEAPEGAFVILDGMACRYVTRAGGRRRIIGYLLPGDLSDPDVGWIDRADHRLGTLTASRVACIHRHDLTRLIERHPGIAQALRRDKLAGEAVLRQWLIGHGGQSSRERLAHLLCELLARLRIVGLADRHGGGLPLSRADLADTLGLSSVHVNRTLQALGREDIVVLRDGALHVADLSRLSALAAFTPHDLAPPSAPVGPGLVPRLGPESALPL